MSAEIQDRERSNELPPEQVTAVLVELDAILASSSFAGSKRCHDFLECVVKHALAGRYDELGERFLGAELFGRKLDFDTGADSIVRVRANDVRRRLAQYYSKRSSPSDVTIGLPSGNYIPSFQLHIAAGKEEDAARASVTPHDESPFGLAVPHRLRSDVHPEHDAPYRLSPSFAKRDLIRLLPIVITVLILTTTVLTGWHFWPTAGKSALEQFWRPFARDKTKVAICLGDSHLYWLMSDTRQKVEDNQPTVLVRPGDISRVPGGGARIGDVRGIISLAGFLNSRGLVTQVLWPEESHNLSLDRTSAIYIGGFNNLFSMNLNQNLRFFFDSEDEGHRTAWFIRDRFHPEKRWTAEKITAQRSDRSYALITRIIDPDQSRVQMAIAGLNEFGTQAACEFLTDGSALSEFARSAPRGWQGRNVQVLLEMDISGTAVASPKIVAIQVW